LYTYRYRIIYYALRDLQSEQVCINPFQDHIATSEPTNDALRNLLTSSQVESPHQKIAVHSTKVLYDVATVQRSESSL
jgi:hypothetical protein